MSQNNPIEIHSDQEQISQVEKRVELQRKRHNFLQAQLGSRFDIIVQVIKAEMNGTPEEKEERVRDRINKFFNSSEKKIDLRNGHFCERKQAIYSHSTTPVSNQIILFGVDFLNVRRIKNFFTGLQPIIQWLDDSNCKVKFRTAENAQKAIQINLRQSQQKRLQVKMEEEDAEVPRCWFQLKPYYELTFERKLLARYSTSDEKQIQPSATRNFVYYNQAKKKFEDTIVKDNIDNYKRLAKNLGFFEERNRKNLRNSRENNFMRGGYNHRRDRSRSRQKNFFNRRNGQERDRPRFNNNMNSSFKRNRRNPRNSSQQRSKSISRSRKSSSDISFILNPDDSEHNSLLIQGMGKLGINPQSYEFENGQNERISNVNAEIEQRQIDDFDDERFPANQNESFHYMDYIEKKEEQEEEERKNNVSYIVLD